jgi:hypothetical protein
MYRKKLAYGLLHEMYQTAEDKKNAIAVITELYHQFQ